MCSRSLWWPTTAGAIPGTAGTTGLGLIHSIIRNITSNIIRSKWCNPTGSPTRCQLTVMGLFAASLKLLPVAATAQTLARG